MSDVGMDEVEQFLRSWIESEYRALVAQYTEREERRFRDQLRDVSLYYAEPIMVDVSRPTMPSESWFESGKQAVEHLVRPRTLFQIKEYVHPGVGKLWRAYISHTTRSDDGEDPYFASMFVANVDGQLKIVSKYHVDDEAPTLGPGIDGWMYRGGVFIEHLGDPKAARKLQAPGDPRDREEYASE